MRPRCYFPRRAVAQRCDRYYSPARYPAGRSPVNESTDENEPQPRGALLLILIYLAILAAFWINT